MSKRIEKKIEATQKDVDKLENSLSGIFTSVRPPTDVIQRLQDRIGRLEPNIIAKRISNWELSLITAGSVMAAAMVILTLARALFYFFGRRKKSTA